MNAGPDGTLEKIIKLDYGAGQHRLERSRSAERYRAEVVAWLRDLLRRCRSRCTGNYQ